MLPFFIKDILIFYQEAGLDYAITNRAKNHLMAPTVDNKTSAKLPSVSKSTEKIESLDALNNLIMSTTDIAIKKTANKTCLGQGIIGAKLMLIGDPPNRDEDKDGRPFSGLAGSLLDKMLAAIEEERSRNYLTHIIPWRPPGNRRPNSIEIELCKPFIEKQIELVKPKVIVALGAIATQILLNNQKSFLSIRGKWQKYTLDDGTSIPLMPTFSPTDLLKLPMQKKHSWQDLLAIKERLKQ